MRRYYRTHIASGLPDIQGSHTRRMLSSWIVFAVVLISSIIYTLPLQATARRTIVTEPDAYGNYITYTYNADMYVVLTAVASKAYEFDHWSNGETDNPLTIDSYDADETLLTAHFNKKACVLDVNTTQAGEGHISATVIDGECNCEWELTAVPNSDKDFVEWSDGETNISRRYTFNDDNTVQPIYRELCDSAAMFHDNMPAGRIYAEQNPLDCRQWTLTATAANPGWSFSEWSDGNSEYPRSYTIIQGAAPIYPVFAHDCETQYFLKEGEHGTVSSAKTSDDPCTWRLTAIADPWYYFFHWGDNRGGNPRVYVPNWQDTLRPIYQEARANITADTAVGGYVTATKLSLREFRIEAHPHDEYNFSHWNDGNEDNPRVVTVNDSITLYTAHYTIKPCDLPIVFDSTEQGYVKVTSLPTDCGCLWQLEAKYNTDHTFVRWSDGVRSATRLHTLSDAMDISPIFRGLCEDSAALFRDNMPAGTLKAVQNMTSDTCEWTVTAIVKADNWVFSHWSDGEIANPRNFVVGPYTDTLYPVFEHSCIAADFFKEARHGTVDTIKTSEMPCSWQLVPHPEDGFYFSHWASTTNKNIYRNNPYNYEPEYLDADTLQPIFKHCQYNSTVMRAAGGRITCYRPNETEEPRRFVLGIETNYNHVFNQWSDGYMLPDREINIPAEDTFDISAKFIYQPTELVTVIEVMPTGLMLNIDESLQGYTTQLFTGATLTPAASSLRHIAGNSYLLTISDIGTLAGEEMQLRFRDNCGEWQYIYNCHCPIIASADAAISDYDLTDAQAGKVSLVVRAGANMNIDEASTFDMIKIEKGGILTLSANTNAQKLFIGGTMSRSSQILNPENLTLSGEAYYDYDILPNGGWVSHKKWFAFAVPFEVDVTTGISYINNLIPTTAVPETDIRICGYDGAVRAMTGGGWGTFLSSGSLYAGSFYLMTLNNHYNTWRFTKKSGTALLYPAGVLTLNEYTSTDAANAGWNALSNPLLHYANASSASAGYAYIYDNNTSAFTAYPIGEYSYVTACPMFVQSSATDVLSLTEGDKGQGKRLNPSWKAVANEEKTAERYTISLTDGTHKDYLYLTLHENATENYDIGKDLTKLRSNEVPQIWTTGYGYNLAAQDRPYTNNSTDYPLYIYAVQAGKHTIDISTDNETGSSYELLYNGKTLEGNGSSIEIPLQQGMNEGYVFRLNAKSPVPTAIDKNAGKSVNAVCKYIYNQHLYIDYQSHTWDAQGAVIK